MVKIYIKCWTFFVFITVLGLLPSPHCSAKIYLDTCGPDAYWAFNTKTHILKIEGTGSVTERIAEDWDNDKGRYFKVPYAGKEFHIKKIIVCQGITSLDCPEGLFAKKQTYKGRKILISLPDSLESIGSLSFCYMDSNITLPKSVKYIAPAAFSFDSQSTGSVRVAEDNPYYCSEDGVIFSKDRKKLIYYPSNKRKKEYIVPDSVTAISPLAFHSASDLERVILPRGLKKLGSGAFFGCSCLKYVNLSDEIKITSITDYDTSGLDWRTDCVKDGDDDELYLKDSKKTAKNLSYGSITASQNRAGTFEATALESIVIPNSVKYIASNTFFNSSWNPTYTHLKKIKFGKDFHGKINVGRGQDGQKTVTLNAVQDLKIIMPQENKTYCVEDGILYSKDKSILYLAANYKKKTLKLPDTVTTIANGAFASNRSIRHLIIGQDIQSIGYNAFAQTEIKTFTCQGTIGKIGKNAFAGSISLEKVTIHNVKYIEEKAFMDCCSLKTADLGESVKQIGPWAFSLCDSLSSLTTGDHVYTVDASSFDSCGRLDKDLIPTPHHILYVSGEIKQFHEQLARSLQSSDCIRKSTFSSLRELMHRKPK